MPEIDPLSAYNERISPITVQSFTQTGALFNINLFIPLTQAAAFEALDLSNTPLVAAWVRAAIKLQKDFYAFCTSKGAGYVPTTEEIETILATFNPTV